MTRYEQGFLTKCAEYGVKRADAQTLLANYAPEALAGALLGGGIGAFTSKKHRLRNALLGALLGGGAGLGARYGLAGKTISALNKNVNAAKGNGSRHAKEIGLRESRLGFQADRDKRYDKIRNFSETGQPPAPVVQELKEPEPLYKRYNRWRAQNPNHTYGQFRDVIAPKIKAEYDKEMAEYNKARKARTAAPQTK